MTNRISIEAQPRLSEQEKAKHLRREGWIPAVIYGHGDNYSIKIENLALRRALREAGTTHLIDIMVDDGTMKTVLAKEIQAHPTRGDLVHVDFYEVDMKETIVVEAALVSEGIAPPQEDGLGTVSLVIHALEIECLPDNLISEITVDFSRIETPDDMIYVRDLVVPENVKVLTDSEQVVARFEYVQLVEEEEEEEEELLFAEETEEVEVIGKGKREEELDEEV